MKNFLQQGKLEDFPTFIIYFAKLVRHYSFVTEKIVAKSEAILNQN